MLKAKYEYSGKKFEITPYNTEQEKELLLLEALDSAEFDFALNVLNVPKEIIESLSEDEKISMLYKHRSISVGEEIPIKYKCGSCSQPNEQTLDITNIIHDSNIKNDKIIDRFKKVTDENVHEFINCDIDDLDIDEYEKLVHEVKSSVTKFDFIKKSSCIKCGKINTFDIRNNVITYMSDDSLLSLYQTYNNLTFFGKYTKQDIDTLYPFERSIIIGLLNKTREELNK